MRTFASAGPHSALEKVRPLLERLGQRLFVIGEDAGSANLVKLAANVLTATTLECMGEVLALLRKDGVDGRLAFEVLSLEEMSAADWQNFEATMKPNTDQMRMLGHYAVDTRRQTRRKR